MDTIKKKLYRGLQYNLRLEPDLHAWLKIQAHITDRSVNYLINQAVKELKQQKESLENAPRTA